MTPQASILKTFQPGSLRSAVVEILDGELEKQAEIAIASRDKRFSRVVEQAFAEKAQEIRAVIDDFKQQDLICATEIALESIPYILDLLETSESLQAEFIKDKAGVVFSVTSKIQDWQMICARKDFEPVPEMSLEGLLGAMKCLARPIEIDGDQGVREANQIAIENLISIFFSLTDPLELMRHCELFLEPTNTDYNFELNDAVQGVFADHYRTKQFIFGVSAAVEELERRFPQATVLHIADLGSGPFGFLGIIALAASSKVHVDFVELEPGSKILLDSIIKELKLESRASTHLANALEWQPQHKLHGILSETLDAAAASEPLTKIAQAMTPHLLEKGIFVPERVSLNLKVVDASALPIEAAIYSGFIDFFSGKFKIYPHEMESPPLVFSTLGCNETQARFIVPLSQISDGGKKLYISTSVDVFGGYDLPENSSLVTQSISLPDLCGVLRSKIGFVMTPEIRAKHQFLILTYELGNYLSTAKLEFK